MVRPDPKRRVEFPVESVVANPPVKEARTMDNDRKDDDGIGQVNPEQIERLRTLEAENVRLKGQVAVLTLDKLILREVVEEFDQEGDREHPRGS
jgi:hypothetical protein